jgi:ribosomal-protein-alanine N-acetyltransferase
MGEMPTLFTDRLELRPFTRDDVPTVTRLAGEREIAATTVSIPHPYNERMAEEWIGSHQGAFDAGKAVTFAITLREETLIGAIEMDIDAANRSAEIGYWVGKPYWNRGYCTEATRAVIRYGFEVQGLNRIQAIHMSKNPASGRVMEKAGMTHEGTLRQSLFRWDRFEDAEIYAILRHDALRDEIASPGPSPTPTVRPDPTPKPPGSPAS